MVIGIFPGSFNPIHSGHAMLASYISESDIVDEVWILTSPQNPLKDTAGYADFHHRQAMCSAVAGYSYKLKASDFESRLEAPYYTINTLRALAKEYPQHHFKLIIGADNLEIFAKWKDWESIVNDFGLIVYPRRGNDLSACALTRNEHVIILEHAPVIEISSTAIRKALREGKNLSFFLIPEVLKYIKTHNLYKDV